MSKHERGERDQEKQHRKGRGKNEDCTGDGRVIEKWMDMFCFGLAPFDFVFLLSRLQLQCVCEDNYYC